MSQYLNFYVRPKDNSEIKLCLGWFGTTPARTIPDSGAFPYTEQLKVLDVDQLRHYERLMQEQVEEKRKFLAGVEQDLVAFNSMLVKCKTKISFDELKEEIAECKVSLTEVQEDIECWENWIKIVNFCISIITDNKDWEFCYSNC